MTNPAQVTKTRTLKITAASAILMLSAAVTADEGMWALHNLPTQAIAETYGAVIDETLSERLQRATTRIEGGCTGSFVSPDGLILTNHHCIRRCLTENSSEASDLHKNGFVASSREDEKRCASEQVSVLLETEEITDKVQTAIDGLDQEEANEVRKATLTALEAACLDDAPAAINQCESVSLYNGGQYFLYKYRRYDDIRLAFAPESAIAAFGGDPDNFNFPRWCLDMALLRAYEDGEPAQSPAFLKWRRSGAEAGAATFITGHPGTTQRLKTIAELDFLRAVSFPAWLERNAELRGRVIQFAELGDEETRVVRQMQLGLENGLKVVRNRQRALLNDSVFSELRAREADLRESVRESESLSARFGDPWAEVELAMTEYRELYDRYQFIENNAGFSSVLFGYARTLVRSAIEREKPAAKRLRAYTGDNLEKLELRVIAPRPVSKALDTLRLGFSLAKMQENFGPDDFFVKLVLGRQAPSNLAERLITATTLDDENVRKEFWDGGLSAIESSDDPLIQLALAIEPEARAQLKRYEDQVEAPIKRAGEQIAAARFARFGTDIYPDATFTLRLTYGAVEGWKEKGEMVTPFTTLAELYPRATEDYPFALPASWQETDLPEETRFNFVLTTDIIGGNSGSPVTNAAGELVGLAFDGNLHSIAGAYFYDQSSNRTVAVHPDVMLGALENVYGADSLLAELEVLP